MPLRNAHLDVVLGEFLGQGTATTGSWIHCIVDSNLSVLVVKPGVDVLSALLQNLLSKHDRRWGGIWIEVVLWNLSAWANCGTPVVTEMKDACLHTKPMGV